MIILKFIIYHLALGMNEKEKCPNEKYDGSGMKGSTLLHYHPDMGVFL